MPEPVFTQVSVYPQEGRKGEEEHKALGLVPGLLNRDSKVPFAEVWSQRGLQVGTFPWPRRRLTPEGHGQRRGQSLLQVVHHFPPAAETTTNVVAENNTNLLS